MGRLGALFCLLMLLAPTAQAGMGGSSSAAGGAGAFEMAQVRAFAADVERALASRRAHVALVARVGVDPEELPQGVRYTHVAFWVYSDITRPDGTTARGYRAHNLYQRAEAPDTSHLVEDSPVEFFAGVQRLETAIIVPDPRLQQKLAAVLTDPASGALHNPAYSLLSNPATNRFQNCTEHMLNLLMAALYDTRDMARIKANIRAHVQPRTIHLDPFVRLFGPAFSDGVSMADHGEQIRTTTFASLRDFMGRYGLSREVFRVTGAGEGGF